VICTKFIYLHYLGQPVFPKKNSGKFSIAWLWASWCLPMEMRIIGNPNGTRRVSVLRLERALLALFYQLQNLVPPEPLVAAVLIINQQLFISILNRRTVNSESGFCSLVNRLI
jgi:hypothetical protein